MPLQWIYFIIYKWIRRNQQHLPELPFSSLKMRPATTRHSLPHTFGRMTDIYVCTFEICKLVVLSMLVLDIKVNRQKHINSIKKKNRLILKYNFIYAFIQNPWTICRNLVMLTVITWQYIKDLPRYLCYNEWINFSGS